MKNCDKSFKQDKIMMLIYKTFIILWFGSFALMFLGGSLFVLFSMIYKIFFSTPEGILSTIILIFSSFLLILFLIIVIVEGYKIMRDEIVEGYKIMKDIFKKKKN